MFLVYRCFIHSEMLTLNLSGISKSGEEIIGMYTGRGYILLYYAPVKTFLRNGNIL